MPRLAAMQHRPFAAVLAALALPLGLAAAIHAEKPRGYLEDGAFDLMAILPAAPVAGDARYAADRKIFKKTRKMIGSPRYELATRDAVETPQALMADFSCAVGVTLSEQDAPRTIALIRRARVDTVKQNTAAKNFYKRQRPFLIDHGRICQPESELKSFDYPSGHTTDGWTWALVLADAVPARATPILARGRAYGDSRFICGAHNYSAVEAGKLGAGSTMTAVRGTAGYQADLAGARAEMAALLARPDAPRPAGCDDEAKLVAQRVP